MEEKANPWGPQGVHPKVKNFFNKNWPFLLVLIATLILSYLLKLGIDSSNMQIWLHKQISVMDIGDVFILMIIHAFFRRFECNCKK